MKYKYWECQTCQFDVVLNKNSRSPRCPICAEDNGICRGMASRPAIDTDKPEGVDERDIIRN